MDERFMRMAIQLALDNVQAGQGGPFAALVVRSGEVIGQGANRVTSDCDPTAHAEVIAIRQACRVLHDFQLRGCEIYTTCEPCPMCLGAIYWARPERVYFAAAAADAARHGFDDAFIYEQISLPPAQRRIPMLQFMHKEGMRPFQAWQAKGDKISY